MPRQSADARSAAAYRAGAEGPPPPKRLGKETAAEWRKIVASKPADWFDAGAQILLEQYVTVVVHERAIWAEIHRLEGEKEPDETEIARFERRACKLVQLMCRLASSLRLSVQASVDWHSRKTGERGATTGDARRDELLGGFAVHGDGRGRKPS